MLNGLRNALYTAWGTLGRARWAAPLVALLRRVVRGVRSGWRTSIDTLASRPRTRPLARQAKLAADRARLELFYAGRDDPYGLAASAIETAKYKHTIDVLDGRRFARALEVGCAAGVFSERLAPFCEELVAVDISAVAVSKARRRLQSIPGAEARRLSIPSQMPEGSFDLIVCSDVLYYWEPHILVDALRRFEESLRPGGSLVALHYLGTPGQGTLMTANRVHDLLASHTTLERAVSETTDRYRLERFDKAA
jgi:SAM-dependent methyltransferase